jgi:hypothetical protein
LTENPKTKRNDRLGDKKEIHHHNAHITTAPLLAIDREANEIKKDQIVASQPVPANLFFFFFF